jgi:predicted  nucleic acid-binding Zn-ribbon protein
MGKVYQLVRGVVRGTLHRQKSDIMVSAPANGDKSSLNNAMEELEKIFLDGIGRLKTAVSADQAVFSSKAEHAEQAVENLKANVTALETKLKETEDSLHRKEVASQKMEETLSSEIGNLQSVVKNKEEALESRDSELNESKSKIDVLTEQVTRSELAMRQAKEEAASKARDAAQVIESLRANIAVIEAKLKETEDTLHKKDVDSRKMEESVRTDIRDLQNVVKNNRDLLLEQVTRSESAIQRAKDEAASEGQHAAQVFEGLKVKIATLESKLTQTEQAVAGTSGTLKGLDQDRDTEVIDFNAELEIQTNGTKNIQEQDNGILIKGEQLKTGEEQPATSHVQAEGITFIVPEATRKTVSQETFDGMIAQFSELTNVIGRMAAVIVRDHVRALGESMKEFPQTRLAELVESLSTEITDDRLKADFRKRFDNP